MNASFYIPQTELDRLSRNLQANAAMVGRELQVEVQQRALNVAGRAFDNVPPSSGSGVEEKRFQVKQYLGQQLAQRVKVAKSGKRKGQIIAFKSGKKQLRRVNLILQAARARHGAKGLYGDRMRILSGAFMGRAERSVGFLKSIFIPVIVTLNPLCRFKFPFAKTRNIARWPGSAGYGRADVRRDRLRPEVSMIVGARVQQDSAKVLGILQGATLAAVTAEANDIERHMNERLQKNLVQ